MEHPNFDKMSYLELTASQARVENSIRDRRIRCVLKTLAEKLSRAERVPSKVGFFEGMLARELKIGRAILIDEYLDMLEILLDVNQDE